MKVLPNNSKPPPPPDRNTNTHSLTKKCRIYLYVPLGRNTKSSNRESVSAVSKLQEKNSYMNTSIRFLLHAHTNMYTHAGNAE